MSDAALALGVPEAAASPTDVHLLANVLVVAPAPVLVALSGVRRAARWGWRDWTAVAFVASATVETVQAVALPSRSATVLDVVANTSGGLLGGVVVALGRRILVRRGRAFDR